ncbi:unnamed protein product [Alternaria alternata]
MAQRPQFRGIFEGTTNISDFIRGYNIEDPKTWPSATIENFPPQWVGQSKPPSFVVYDYATIERWMDRSSIKNNTVKAKEAFTDYPFNFNWNGMSYSVPLEDLSSKQLNEWKERRTIRQGVDRIQFYAQKPSGKHTRSPTAKFDTQHSHGAVHEETSKNYLQEHTSFFEDHGIPVDNNDATDIDDESAIAEIEQQLINPGNGFVPEKLIYQNSVTDGVKVMADQENGSGLKLSEITKGSAHAFIKRTYDEAGIGNMRDVFAGLTDVISKRAKVAKDLDDTYRRLEGTKRDLEDNRRELEDTRRELENTKKRLDDANEELDDAKGEFEDANGKLGDATRELSSSRDALKQAELRVKVEQKEKDRYHQWWLEGQEEMKTLQNEFALVVSHVDTLRNCPSNATS